MTILNRIIGSVIKETLEIDLKPKMFIIPAIAINTSITISRSTLGKYIKTRLSAKVLITNPETVKKYTQTLIQKAFFKILPPVYSQISARSLPGKRSNILVAR